MKPPDLGGGAGLPPAPTRLHTCHAHSPRHLGPWLVEALLLGGVLLGSGAVGVAARRPRRFGLRWSSWHWAPRGHTPLREKSGHSSVCFFLHCGRRGAAGRAGGDPGTTWGPRLLCPVGLKLKRSCCGAEVLRPEAPGRGQSEGQGHCPGCTSTTQPGPGPGLRLGWGFPGRYLLLTAAHLSWQRTRVGGTPQGVHRQAGQGNRWPQLCPPDPQGAQSLDPRPASPWPPCPHGRN